MTVVGAGFVFLLGIDNWLRNQGRREQFKRVFFTPAPKPGARPGPRAVEGILSDMAGRGIVTHLGHKMKAFESNKVITEATEYEADYSTGFARNFFSEPRCFLDSMRLFFAARLGRVGIRFRRVFSTLWIKPVRRVNASLRFFSCVR